MNPFEKLKLLKAGLKKDNDWYYITLPSLYNPNDSLHWKMKHREMKREALLTIEADKARISECRKEISIYKKSLTLIVL